MREFDNIVMLDAIIYSFTESEKKLYPLLDTHTYDYVQLSRGAVSCYVNKTTTTRPNTIYTHWPIISEYIYPCADSQVRQG